MKDILWVINAEIQVFSKRSQKYSFHCVYIILYNFLFYFFTSMTSAMGVMVLVLREPMRNLAAL